jgi:hypothetical protein
MKTEGAETGARGTSRPWYVDHWPLIAMVAAGQALLVFIFLGPGPSVIFGIFQVPPLYGYWVPVAIDPVPLALTSAVLLGGVIVFLMAKRWTIGLGLLLVVLGVLLAFGVGMVRSDIDLLTRSVKTRMYVLDIDLVDVYGVRGFAEAHPDLTEHLEYNSMTHPPGPVLLLYGFYAVLGDHAMRVAAGVAGLGLAASWVAYAVARTVGDTTSGKIAFVMFLAAPGPLLLAFSSLDVVFALLLSAGAACFMYSLSRDVWRWSAVGGAVLGVATLFTFASAFIAVAVALTATVVLRPSKRIIIHLAAAGVGGLVVLGVARLAIRIDVLASYGSVPDVNWTYDPYWLVGSPAALMIFLGLPILAFGLRGLVRRELRDHGTLLVIVLLFLALIWFALPTQITNLRPGEVERTWSFLYPLIAGIAGVEARRWAKTARVMPAVVAVGLCVLSIAQAVWIESHWDIIS